MEDCGSGDCRQSLVPEDENFIPIQSKTHGIHYLELEMRRKMG